MLKQMRKFGAALIVGLVLLSIPYVHAESITNDAFLKMSQEQKYYWVLSTIDTLGFIAGYKNKEQGKCVWAWYYQEDDLPAKRGLIESHMRQYPDRSPTEIFIAMTEQVCGRYVRPNKR